MLPVLISRVSRMLTIPSGSRLSKRVPRTRFNGSKVPATHRLGWLIAVKRPIQSVAVDALIDTSAWPSLGNLALPGTPG